MKTKTPEQVWADILATRGLPSEIARHCGISAQAVHKWKQVPPNRVRTVAVITGLTPEQIRPDVFSPLDPNVRIPRMTKKPK